MPTHPAIRNCLKWFDAYSREYVAEASKDILLSVQGKISHTMRVLAHVRAILDETNFPEDIRLAAEAAAVLHDVGRFPQLVNKATFDDKAGYNHAEEGADAMGRTELMEQFSPAVQDLILTAIRYHNRGELPDDLDHDHQSVLEVLRDADKLDAIRCNVKYMSPDTPYGKALKSGMVWDDNAVSDAVLDMALKRILIPFESIKWSNDYVLFLTCWIYDLHFPYTYRKLYESGDFSILLEMLPDTDIFKTVKKQLLNDLKKPLKQG